MTRNIVLTVFMVLLFSSAAGAREYTYPELVNKLSDLEGLAELPAEGEKCAQFSSYDRASRYDEVGGEYVNWRANGDGDGYIRKEGENIVIAEMQGPGVIWRIWTALAEQGHVKIYLDGADTPAVDLPFIGYFNRENEPFTFLSLVHKTARGQNCYVPIPYQESCRIVAEPGWGRYYHFTYTTFPEGTKLPTFSMDLSDADMKALREANRILSDCGQAPPGVKQKQKVRRTVRAAPGAKTEVLELQGRRAITALKVKVDSLDSQNQRNVLRDLLLSIYWDGEKEPSVWAPLGDFFGTTPGVNKYRSLPLGMTDEGFYSYWYMPFESGARIMLANRGDSEQKVTFEISHNPLSGRAEELGRFHAKWHGDKFLPESENRWPDWTLLKTTGRGRFCGVMLYVWNPKGGWWGEGDEKFFVDGEKFPSTYGTGSEDYFGYAWCTPELFQNAFHNQTISMGNKGHISVNRWHIADNIPFRKSFEGCIEKYFRNWRPTLYSAVAYWYLEPGGDDPYPADPVDKPWGYRTPPVEPPMFSNDTGVFVEGGTVELKTPTKGSRVRYTTDGSEPTPDSKEYTKPVKITESTIIKAKAFKPAHPPSPTVSSSWRRTTYKPALELTKQLSKGLQYRLFEGNWNNLPDFGKLTPIRTGTKAQPRLSDDTPQANFALEFTGYMDVAGDGIYSFYVTSDDGSRLFIDDQAIVDNDGLHGPEEKSGQVALRAGLHKIKIQYFQRAGSKHLDLGYSGPGIGKVRMPGEILMH